MTDKKVLEEIKQSRINIAKMREELRLMVDKLTYEERRLIKIEICIIDKVVIAEGEIK